MIHSIHGILASIFVWCLLPILWAFYIVFDKIFRFLPINIDPRVEALSKTSNFTICKTLYSKGLLTDKQYEYEKNVFNETDKEVIIGYTYLILPITLYLQNHNQFDWLLRFIVLRVFQPAHGNQSKKLAIFMYFARNLGTSINKAKTTMLWLADRGVIQVISVISPVFVVGTLMLAEPNLYQYIGTAFATIFTLLFVESLGNGLEVRYKKSDGMVYVGAITLIAAYILTMGAMCVYGLSWELMFLLGNAAILIGSLGYPIVHELAHRKDKTSKTLYSILSYILLMPTFKIFHNKGHHKDLVGVAASDEVVADYNESIHTYLLRQVLHTSKKGYHLAKGEYLRLRAIEASIVLGLYVVNPLMALAAVTIQIYAFLILETINYVEHFSLAQEDNPRDRSVDSINLLMNHSFFNVGYHSHHHTNPTVKHYSLEAKSKYITSYGYISQFYMAYLPGTWEAHQQSLRG